MVGVVATATYFLVTVSLDGTLVRIEPVAASAVGFGVSVLVSYFGHHRFTFRASGEHYHYFPRFLAVTLALFLLSTAAVAMFRDLMGYNHTLVTAAISIAYPIVSYGLNCLWIFARALPE